MWTARIASVRGRGTSASASVAASMSLLTLSYAREMSMQREHNASLDLLGGSGLTRSVRGAAVFGQEGTHLSAVAGYTLQGL